MTKTQAKKWTERNYKKPWVGIAQFHNHPEFGDNKVYRIGYVGVILPCIEIVGEGLDWEEAVSRAEKRMSDDIMKRGYDRDSKLSSNEIPQRF